MKKLIYILLFVSITVSPFYFLGSGYPQISDVLLLIAILIFMFNYRIKKDKIFITIFIIVLLISVTNLTWGIIHSDITFIFSIGFYIFNFLFLIMIINLYDSHKNEVLEVIYKAICLSVLIQTILAPLITQSGHSRQTLFFNNPNQLGYYALLTFSILTLLYYLLKKGTIVYIVISVMIVYLALLSNSSATILAVILVLLVQIMIIFIFRFNIKKKVLSIFLIGIFVLVISNYWIELTNINLIQTTLERYTAKESKSQSIYYERGYNIIFENPEYLIFGAGEGNHTRFSRIEIHSTLFAFLFNYGIITISFLIILLFLLIRRPTIISLIILLAIYFYGLTHNGIRQPLFWLTHAIIFFGNKDINFNFNQISYNLKSKRYKKNEIDK